MVLSEQGMEKGARVVMGRLDIWLGGWRLVEDGLLVEGTARGAGGTGREFPHDCTARRRVWWSESSWSGALWIVWELGNSRVLRSEFDLAWMFRRVWGQAFDVLKGRELKFGLDWERREKCQRWKWELSGFEWEEESMWPLVGRYVLCGQLPLDKLSERVWSGKKMLVWAWSDGEGQDLQ